MAHHHTISGLVGKLVTESEVNCDADKYYKIFKHHEEVPDAIPHIYTGVKVVEGHGLTSGCVKRWNYIVDGKEEWVHERTTYNDETRTIVHNDFEGHVMEKYKKFDAILQVKPKANGKGSIVSWTIEYEKINEDMPVPIDYLGFFQAIIEDLNTHICASE
ncbi:hypothetical protein MKW94_007013 [Papaver nudicaule]|uniref:Bet v I/Major latex protein domain-containing protein n=1 Tax=Papaver nudicaule TaxID=74823 RepID=A0AA41V643_PAPNU|nr:hypothetical protein [Papaver nudicaule]